jgi:uncharacterized iron-regulated protein
MARTTTLALALLVAAGTAVTAASRVYDLAIGDPARRDRTVEVPLDAIVDTRAGTTLTPQDLPARLTGARLVLLGETHTHEEAHRVQLRVIRALHATGRRVLIGLEMFPYTEQKVLDEWNAGRLTEQEFVARSRWYEHWGYHWHYYRDIFLFAREQGLPMHAVNTPREVVTAVRKKGFENLTEEEAAHVPPRIDTDHPEHMTLFKASVGEADPVHGGMSPEAWQGMLAAQATWDASMGYNAVRALEAAGDPKAVMVVLVGSGHVAYGLGIERQARLWFDGGIASVIPVPIRDAQGAVKEVRASYADFIWGVPYEAELRFPSLGVSTRAAAGGAGRQVLFVEPHSSAARAGFQVGDLLVSMDGHPLPDRETLNRLMAEKTWGDAADFVVRRGDQEQTLRAYFRRTPPAS